MDNLKFEVGADGVAVISFDMPGRSMNVLNEGSIADYETAVERVISDPAIKGAVVTSAKPSFIAGADLDWILAMAEADLPGRERARNVYDTTLRLQMILRRTENGGKPFVAAINGLALGGGFELCLACTRIVVADDPRIQLGLPEAKVGLLPGGGGTQRFARLMGPLQALPLLLEGRTVSPRAALSQGLIAEVAPADEIVERARQWILSSTPDDWIKPWDRKGYKPPGDDPRTMEGSIAFSVANALQRKKTWGNAPNLDAIQKAVYDGINVPLETALRIETRYFASLMVSDTARNMVRTQFVNLQKAAKLPGRPQSVPARKVGRLGVLGAGMMGAGIAHVAARAGVDVVVLDRDAETAGRAVSHARDLCAADVTRGRLGEQAVSEIVARITPTADFAALSGVDLIIEAVFEDRAVKADVTRKAEAAAPGAIIASNTSTLPISGLAEAVSDQSRFVGMHFFSPVEKMPLVEIITGKRTGDEALALALDFARQIRKTPIVVNDSRGFYTSRVFGTYTREGCLMLREGVNPALIDNGGRLAGMPVGPLALCDEVALDLIDRVSRQEAADLSRAFPADPAEELIAGMVARGRVGKKAGKGFYDYPAEARKRLWHDLDSVAGLAEEQPSVEAVKERLLTVQALEAVRCLEEGVVNAPEDADVGAYLGWGFAPWTGGPISYVDTVGAARFVETCKRLEQSCGPRFKPTARLEQMARENAAFYPRPARSAA